MRRAASEENKNLNERRRKKLNISYRLRDTSKFAAQHKFVA